MINPDLKSWVTYLFLIIVFFVSFALSLVEKDCEVCFGVVSKLQNQLKSDEKTNQAKIEEKFKFLCKDLRKSEHRFCYYIGGLDESATKIVTELSKPLSYSLPVDKICERLKKKDSQVCDLRYEKEIDLKNVDLKTLRVRDLKKILSNWDEKCDSCIEKSEFIKRIEELKPIYVKEEL